MYVIYSILFSFWINIFQELLGFRSVHFSINWESRVCATQTSPWHGFQKLIKFATYSGHIVSTNVICVYNHIGHVPYNTQENKMSMRTYICASIVNESFIQLTQLVCI